MRTNIHPEYREVLFHDTNANAYFIIGSTLNSNNTREYEGKSYPYVSLDISSASHPFYTGEQRQVNNDARIANLNKRFARFKR